MPDTDLVAEIVANPEPHGFAWYVGAVERDGQQFRNAQLVKHLDVDKLRATFGDAFFLASSDGTSRHVTNQAINRNAWWDNKTIKPDALKRLVVENMLGMKSTRKRTVIVETKYMAADGQSYATEVEALAATRAWIVDQQLAQE